MRDEAVLGVDAVREAADGLVTAFVHVGERIATDGARVDEVERRDSLAWRTRAHNGRAGGEWGKQGWRAGGGLSAVKCVE
jgi:hypothetical protein